MYIGQELPELTPVEIVGCEVCEAGSPLALDDGWFTSIKELLDSLKSRYGYNDLDAMLVLKDILAHTWNSKKQ